MAGGGTEAAGVEQPRHQLLGSLFGLDLERLLVLAREHQPGLQLEQRRQQHDELGSGLQLELPAAVQVVEVGEHDIGELQLEQVHLLAQDEREQQVEGPREDVQVQLEGRDAHLPTAQRAAAKLIGSPYRPRPTRRAHPHALTHVQQRLRSNRAGAGGTVGEDRLERLRLLAQLLVTLAHGR